MSGVLLRAAALLGIYLLVLTSVHPGDVLIGGGLAVAVAFVLRPHRAWSPEQPPGRLLRLRAAAGVAAETALEMVRGSWRVVRFCLGAPGRPGFVEIPRGARSPANTALWGILTGEAPDEVPVDIDEERDVLIVHLVDAGDPDAVRARHRRAYEARQRHVVP